MKYYQAKENRIVCCSDKEISSQVWDKSWEKYDIPKEMKNNLNDRMILKTTQKYLTQGSLILEGGCGLGVKVNCLDQHNYKSIGLDYAINTLRRAKEVVPALELHYGSIMNLPYKSDSFDGYWSLGVIEHFWDGYQDALEEMYRCLKKDGYVFLTFPSMSALRNLKVKLNSYQTLEKQKAENFYQFLLDPRQVQTNFEKQGFKLLEEKGLAGMKGFKDEVSLLKPMLQKIYDGQSFLSRCTSYGLSILLQSFARHATLQVYQK